MKPLKLSALTVALSLCLCAAASAQVMRERPGVKAPTPADPGTPACAADDKVQVTGFSLDPAQPSPGQSVTVRLTVKSRCPSGTKPLDMQWEITDEGDRQLGNGDARLDPGASSSFTATWTAAAGAHKLRGDAYAQEATSGQQNNWREVSVTVQPKLVTMTLNHVKAKNGGAGFTANAAGATTCTIESNAGQSMPTWKDDVATFRVACSVSPSGGKGDFEAYSGFTLKNGWKIKSYEVEGPTRTGASTGSDWSWVSTPPSAGSTNPYVKWHLWAHAGAIITVGIKIIIEGPEGTDPYQ